MKPAATALAILALVLSVACSSTRSRTPPTENEIRAVIDAQVEAVRNGDRRFFERHLAREYVGTTTEGRVVNRQAFLDTFAPPPASVNPSFEITDIRFSSRRDVAVVNALRTFRATINARPVEQRERTTQVFIREDGRWKLLAEQSTPVSP